MPVEQPIKVATADAEGGGDLLHRQRPVAAGGNIPSLIDCGVDILNPIQPGVYKMECERLKADFGDKIAFWGGIDTQHLLPESTEQEVKNEVKRILSIMDKDGGYILSPAHTIQYDVPAQNVIAIYRGADEYYGRYR